MQDNTLKKYNFFNKREIITEISNDYEKINLTNLTSLKIYSYEKYIFISCKIPNSINININTDNSSKTSKKFQSKQTSIVLSRFSTIK